MKSTPLDLLFKYIDKDALCGVMLTGSVAAGTATENSDVDLVIISKYSSRQSTETIVDNGKEYQLIVFPINKFAPAIFKDIINGEYVFTSMFKSGVIIYDPNGLLRVFKNFVAGVSPKIKDVDIMALRHSISVNLDYIRRNGENAFGAVLETILSMERLIVGRSHYMGKHIDKNMKDNTTISKLKEILLEYLEAGDVERFAGAINLLLKPYGGKLTTYSTSSVLLTPNTDDCIMAFVPGKKPYDTDIFHMLRTITEAFPTAYPIIFYTGQGQYLQMGTYVILHSKEHRPVKLYQEMNALRKRHANSFPQNIVCPYQTFYLEANVIGDSQAKELLVPSLSMLSTYMLSNHEGKSLRLYASYKMCLCFHGVMIKGKWDGFVMDCLMKYLPEAVDINTSYNITQLCERRKTLMNVYEQTFERSEKALRETLANEEIEDDDLASCLNSLTNNIKSVLNTENNENAFNKDTFIDKSNAILFNILDLALSITGLEPHEKFPIVYNISRLVKDQNVYR